MQILIIFAEKNMIWQSLIQAISEAFNELYGQPLSPELINIQQTNAQFRNDADITLMVFPLVRISKRSPEQTANDIGNYLQNKLDYVESFSVVKGFLNLRIAQNFWITFLKNNYTDTTFGIKTPDTTQAPFIVEYSSPNTNKPLHLGHIRNNLLGDSISKILKANGQNVLQVNLVNDRGIHICKSMLAWQKWGKDETPETSGLKGDKLVGKYYVMFDKKYKAQLSRILRKAIKIIYTELNTDNFDENSILKKLTDGFPYTPEDILLLTKIIKEELVKIGKQSATFIPSIPYEAERDFMEKLKDKSKLLNEAQEMLKKWETGDTEVKKLWKTMNKWVYAGFDVTYKSLGIDFDKTYYESQTYLLGKDVVKEGVKEGVFYTKQDGSVWIDLSDEGLDEKLLLRANGTSVYMTQDLGTASARFNEFHPSKMIYVVGNEQNYHFDVLKKVLSKMHYSWADNIRHFSYGMVELPEGKMKSREGTVVDADDLIAEVIETARQTTMELGKLESFDTQEAQNLFRILGLGGLKYFILKVDPMKNMMFNPKESIDFTGNTGPFIQYTYARIQSLLRKSDNDVAKLDLSGNIDIHHEERELLFLCSDFNRIVKLAADELSPAQIANYVYELAKQYNQFYQRISVLKEENEKLRDFRLALSYFTAVIIRNSMNLLGIEVPQRM